MSRTLEILRTAIQSSTTPFLAFGMLAGGMAVETSAAAQAVPSTFYAAPTSLVSLRDGRKLAFSCMGRGSPVVLLSAGAGDSSAGWATVQGEIAKTTRVCAWDRPGFGHSDPSPNMDSGHLVQDLSDGLRAARIPSPYVIVGHSLGGFETRLFADLYRHKVVGMVLVDASLEHQSARIDAVSPYIKKVQQAQMAALHGCLDAKKHGELTPGSVLLARCAGAPGEPLVNLIDTMDALSSEQLDKARISYGSMPLIVLSHGVSDSIGGTPPNETAAVNALWERMQGEQAALSAAGERRIVEGAGHFIQNDKPQAVIDAVNSVVAKACSSVRNGSKADTRQMSAMGGKLPHH
jgi:pimeloyl-ACP methyl ester carboxylesterase